MTRTARRLRAAAYPATVAIIALSLLAPNSVSAATAEPSHAGVSTHGATTGVTGGTISGRVTLEGGLAPGSAIVTVVDRDGISSSNRWPSSDMKPDGSYTVRDIPPGNWTVKFFASGADGEPYVPEYWGDKTYRSQATFFAVTAKTALKNVNATLVRGASVSGRVTDPSGKPLPNVEVFLDSAQTFTTGVKFREEDSYATTDANGAYTVRAVPPGLWVLYFYAPPGTPYRDEWWSDRRWGDGVPIRVLPQARVTGKNAQLTYASQGRAWGKVSRLAGGDRYETAVRISASQFAPGVPTAYIASGTSFPDALSAAPVAAGGGGPILLSDPGSLPGVVADELRRLRPQRIVILGGPAAISATVERKLASLTSGSVTRLGGADRYATSAAVSKSRFTPGVPVAYLTSGTKFPDALSAAPHAALGDGPILLTGPDELSPATLAELKRLRPEVVQIIGGGVVGPQAYAQVDSLAAGFAIISSGQDRYETSTLLSAWFDYGVSVAYVASGEQFPDALAAGPVAGTTSGPVLLTPRAGLPTSIANELRRLRPDRIVILGGTQAVSAHVEAQLKALAR